MKEIEEDWNPMEMWEKEKCEYLDNIYNKNINNDTMKRILVTTEKLNEKINNFNDNRGYVIYFDIMNKEILKDKQFMSMIGDGDNLYELDNNIFFIRNAPIEIYKALVENIEKNKDDEYLINRLLPKGLYDFNKKIEYYTDDNKNDIIIKNINI